MKKIILAFVLFALISSTAFSQISGGLFVGPNLSWFGVDSKMQSNEGVRPGYEFGAWSDFPLSDNFVFNLAIKYNDIGGTMSYQYGSIIDLYDINRIDIIAAGENIKYNLSYLSIPIGFKGKTNEIGFMSYFMKAGIAPMINLKGMADVTVDSNDLITKNISPISMSWYMGAGFEWSLSGNTRFVTEIVYNGGILDFVRNKNDELTIDVFEDDDKTVRDHVGKTNSISLKLGILF
ncbi:MAG: porin family protein [Bacteroidales bacterium]|jgi:hypothetical protein|nr:porin family protein [Bacteroidales bacterium]